MDLVRKSSWLPIGIVSLLLVACASPPSVPLTREQIRANRERTIQRAVMSAAAAGEDPLPVYERLHLIGCLADAQRSPTVAADIAQCRIMWPQPVQQQRQTVTTNCYSVDGNTQCTSQ